MSVAEELAAIVPADCLTQLGGFAELADQHRQGDFADLIVIVQAWSDEFPFREFVKIPGVGPLTRVICCYGPWCVSDGRSRQDWPLAIRVPVEHFRSVLRDEWQQLVNPDPREVRWLPWTAGRDEIFAARWRATLTAASTNGRASIRLVTPDRALSEMWSEVFRQAGWESTNVPSEGQVVLWDVDPWSNETDAPWAIELQTLPATQVAALTGFAGQDVVRNLQDLGAATVISKLSPLDSVIIELTDLISSNA